MSSESATGAENDVNNIESVQTKSNVDQTDISLVFYLKKKINLFFDRPKSVNFYFISKSHNCSL